MTKSSDLYKKKCLLQKTYQSTGTYARSLILYLMVTPRDFANGIGFGLDLVFANGMHGIC